MFKNRAAATPAIQKRWKPFAAVPLATAVAAWAGGAPFAVAAAALATISAQILAAMVAADGRSACVTHIENTLRRLRLTGGAGCVLLMEFDRFKLLEERFDRPVIDDLLERCQSRMAATLSRGDRIFRFENAGFGIVLAPTGTATLETAIQISGRLQKAAAQAVVIDGMNVALSPCVGFALSDRLINADGEGMVQAATNALIEAQRNGPAAIRSFSPTMRAKIQQRNEMSLQVSTAIERGEIGAFFQPQISTRTGRITGFETLARWQHPQRGLIPPMEFLPALAQAGLMERLGEIMVNDALSALSRWDAAGFAIPRVGVNFSNEELQTPDLVDRVQAALDRFCMSPDRLAVEVLETVVAQGNDDAAVRNLAALARLGCSIDLDDFGTGHASITSIRRYAIERIKIDRSFVINIDADAEQQKMVAAILTMAERLGLDTLAEGVETPEEQRMLMRLGCGHVQGYGISRPLPPSEVDAWIANFLSGPHTPHRFVKKAG